MDRRHFGAWLCVLLGIKATETTAMAASTPSPTNKKGLMCIYINVGQLPPFKAEAYIERLKDKFRTSSFHSDWEVWWLPVRQQETRVEFHDINNIINGSSVDINLKELVNDGVPFVAPDRKKTTDAILMYLGAPVCQIELDQQQLDLVYDETKALFEKSVRIGCLSDEIFKNVALAKATIMLGMVRSKWKNVEGIVMLNGADLIKSGTEDLAQWLAYLDV